MMIRTHMKYPSIRSLLLAIMTTMAFIPLNAQRQNWSPMNREIIVSFKDSTIRAYVLIMTTDINASDKLVYYWYDQDQINRNIGGYSGALLDRPYKVYDRQKNLITQGRFRKGLLDGKWKYWDRNGILRKTMNYKNGLLHGEYKVFDEEGNISEIRKYRKGKRK